MKHFEFLTWLYYTKIWIQMKTWLLLFSFIDIVQYVNEFLDVYFKHASIGHKKIKYWVRKSSYWLNVMGFLVCFSRGSRCLWSCYRERSGCRTVRGWPAHRSTMWRPASSVWLTSVRLDGSYLCAGDNRSIKFVFCVSLKFKPFSVQ